MATATATPTAAADRRLARGAAIMWVTAVVVPVLALPAHYPYNLDTAGHLGLIYADTVLFAVGAALALAGLQRRRATR
jgi:hypothetical protein